MEFNVSEIMFALIRSEISGEQLSESVKKAINADVLSKLYSLSKPQDITNILASALLREELLSEGDLKNAFSKEQMTAVFRYAQIRHELERMCRALDAAEIDYILLKGSVIRKYYPKPEMRTSCDIDIYVRESDLASAEKVMTETLKYKFDLRTPHDVAYYSQSKTHVELHYDFIENNDKVQGVLSQVWEMSELDGIHKHGYIMNNEMFVTYHIIHMAKHFSHGGCGIRPFLDLSIAKNKMGYDKNRVLELLGECELTRFGEEAMLLSDVWFGGGEHTDLTRKIERYILGSAIYGTVENSVAINRAKSGGRFGYIIKRLFMPYSLLKKIYPRLEKYPILFPFYQVKRWCRFIYRGRLSRAREEIRLNTRQETQEQKEMLDMLDSLGLK